MDNDQTFSMSGIIFPKKVLAFQTFPYYFPTADIYKYIPFILCTACLASQLGDFNAHIHPQHFHEINKNKM